MEHENLKLSNDMENILINTLYDRKLSNYEHLNLIK